MPERKVLRAVGRQVRFVNSLARIKGAFEG